MRRLLIVVLVAATTAVAQSGPQPVVPDIAMQDQFERRHDVKDHRGDVLVMTYGDRQGGPASKEIGERIHVHFHPTAAGQPPAKGRLAPVRPVADAPAGSRSPDVVLVPVACIGKVPAPVLALIRAHIKRDVPDMPLWMDTEDVMKTKFPFQAQVPNLIVLDTQGRYRYTTSGMPTQEGLQQLLGVIEALRREAVLPPK